MSMIRSAPKVVTFGILITKTTWKRGCYNLTAKDLKSSSAWQPAHLMFDPDEMDNTDQMGNLLSTNSYQLQISWKSLWSAYKMMC